MPQSMTVWAMLAGCLVLASAAGIGPSLAATDADKRGPLPASSKWILDRDGERCVLSRRFGSEDDPAFLQFIRYGPDDGFRFNLIGRRFATQENLPYLRIRFGRAGNAVRGQAMTGRMGGMPVIFTSGRLDNLELSDEIDSQVGRVTPAMEAAATEAHVALSGRKWAFALGAMDRPMAALRTCESELVRSWGLDPQVQAALSSRPVLVGDPRRWLRSEDYPEGMILAGQQAIIAFRLMVDAQGQPTACAVQSNIARDKIFAEITCAILMRRARFTPARSATGEAVASYYTNQVNWVIP